MLEAPSSVRLGQCVLIQREHDASDASIIVLCFGNVQVKFDSLHSMGPHRTVDHCLQSYAALWVNWSTNVGYCDIFDKSSCHHDKLVLRL